MLLMNKCHAPRVCTLQTEWAHSGLPYFYIYDIVYTMPHNNIMTHIVENSGHVHPGVYYVNVSTLHFRAPSIRLCNILTVGSSC